MADTKQVQPAHPPAAMTEADGINYRGIVWFVGILVVTTLVCQVLMLGTFKLFEHQVGQADPGRPPMMAPVTYPQAHAEAGAPPLAPGVPVDIGAPGPALLTDESSNLKDFRLKEDEEMHAYGWIDKNAGVVRIPIDKAKDLLIERGIPGGKPMPTASAPATAAPAAAAKTGKGGR